jgi:GalNAc-alpha-(1->4)-GalNAc-alpha-(1->3)-diNAcBac-PP-undecaprenol alpha-1,4-N-acetyl-D-galactosaminyltransferase
MKILFIISSLSSGGAERVITNLANHLSKKHEIIIVVFSKEEPFYTLSENIQLIQLDLLNESINIFHSILNSINRILILKKNLKKIKADINISFIVHTNILSIIASKLNNQKIIVSERMIFNFYNSKILHFFRKSTYPFCNYLITQTEEDKQNYPYLENVQVIPNPIVFNTPKKDQRQKIVLAVGRLDKQKGFDKLIQSFASIEQNEWKLCIAGDGIEEKNLKKLTKKLNLYNVEFLGRQRDIEAWYAQSSIFVLSSEKEGFPNVLLEAMASECAVISFDCPNGPSEIIKNEINGVLVENQNVEKLSEAIQRLMEDEYLRKRLGKEAKKVTQIYSIKKVINDWENIITKVIST